MVVMSKVFVKIFTIAVLFLNSVVSNDAILVETISKGTGPQVTASHKYRSMVTLYIENEDKSKTPSGWSTRKEEGAARDSPFEFQPGVGLITGWTEGVLQMKEGERAFLHVPANKGYGANPMGSPNAGAGGFYIPANSNLLFDIEILGKANLASDL
uniref:peptidylprolyl isomerase n=1 Tax=Proboscia inermis TaxID=420281 RepID=A0A7S0C6Y5_9STRA|mmetsp:Transcript_65801/g.77326  ORF Transcript_65801/g.77326 Transcript_65801/m.77326 type:complete len:156 (-) Transcript_65801:14-481(-)|eukprot:CAMPEP_0194354180 /NCGR_PEP_ID=MMETSP0174-20130528/2388_1 /TAXON_ID=216777 /ORGANISM="Proboscia alata, Strain PI-D3" /LENGTH=155 /DNA_ID=CAMNT_0039123023 /DNA_START=33 /DNA_END=500 /DNA_ORIENTATION=+